MDGFSLQQGFDQSYYKLTRLLAQWLAILMIRKSNKQSNFSLFYFILIDLNADIVGLIKHGYIWIKIDLIKSYFTET